MVCRSSKRRRGNGNKNPKHLEIVLANPKVPTEAVRKVKKEDIIGRSEKWALIIQE